jgi:hypothetical protein
MWHDGVKNKNKRSGYNTSFAELTDNLRGEAGPDDIQRRTRNPLKRRRFDTRQAGTRK